MATTVACLSGEPALNPLSQPKLHFGSESSELIVNTSGLRRSGTPGFRRGSDEVTLELVAENERVPQWERAKLTWRATNAVSCHASGGWRGAKGTSGSYYSHKLRYGNIFHLSCSGRNGKGVMKSVRVRANLETEAQVEISLRAEPSVVAPGQSARLHWTSNNAGKCFADGDWAGRQSVRGAFDTGPLNRSGTYRLRCENNTHSQVAVVTVATRGDQSEPTAEPASGKADALVWQAPTRNADGTRANDIAGYKIYWGSKRGRYTRSHTINDPSVTRWAPSGLTPGQYYFAVAAFDRAGNESDKSAPLRRRVK